MLLPLPEAEVIDRTKIDSNSFFLKSICSL